MSYKVSRKFKNIEYPVPGIDTAIEVLRPGAAWDMVGNKFDAWRDPEDRDPPSWAEIQEEIHREYKIYDYYEYERNRSKEYPDIKEQLDMLYHDIKSGNLNNGTWITAIDAVKENNPKPEGPAPKL